MNLFKKLLIAFIVISIIGISACSSPSTTPTTQTGGGNSVTINLSATALAFDKSTITVPHGATVTINFTNHDGVEHNFVLYTNSTASTAIFVGQLITGPNKSITYTFTAPSSPGTYFFRCGVHPTTMTGDFIVT
jgi:plastocyanin